MANQHFEPDWAGLFQEIQDEMTKWRRANPKATMRQIELASEAVLARLHARIVQDVAAASHLADFAGMSAEDRPVCPSCNVPLEARGRKERSVRTHGDQRVLLERTQGACPRCGQAFSPSG